VVGNFGQKIRLNGEHLLVSPGPKG
jgi:hypothetical protein